MDINLSRPANVCLESHAVYLRHAELDNFVLMVLVSRYFAHYYVLVGMSTLLTVLVSLKQLYVMLLPHAKLDSIV